MFTEDEIAHMEREDGDGFMPLLVRRQMAAEMRRQNEAEIRFAALAR